MKVHVIAKEIKANASGLVVDVLTRKANVSKQKNCDTICVTMIVKNCTD